MSGTQRRRITSRMEYGWSGSVSDLRSLADFVSEQMSLRRDSALSELRASERPLTDYEVARVENAFIIRGRATYRSSHGSTESTEDTASDLLADLDLRAIESFNLSNSGDAGTRRDRVTIDLRRWDVCLTVDSDDAAWARGLEANILAELRKNRPWWSHLRGKAGILVSWILWFATSLAYFLPNSPNRIKDTGSLVWITFILSAASWFAIRWLLPAFDISNTSTAGRTTRRVAGFGAFALPVILFALSLVI